MGTLMIVEVFTLMYASKAHGKPKETIKKWKKFSQKRRAAEIKEKSAKIKVVCDATASRVHMQTTRPQRCGGVIFEWLGKWIS